MADILKIGSSTLLSMQQALSTTGHNIANVNTEGFSRQRVDFAALGASDAGFGYLGNGSSIAGVSRAHDRFTENQIHAFTSGKSGYQAFLALSTRLDEALGNTASGLNASLQSFFDAVQDLAANPAGMPERQVLLAEAGNLAARQQKLDTLMRDLGQDVNEGLRAAVNEINTLADSIGALNRKIVSASSAGRPPNDLLDQRDALIRRLAEKVSVTTVAQDDGALNVFVGKGQGLVVGNVVSHLKVTPGPFDATRLEIGLAGGKGSITGMLGGGELQGLLDFRERLLEPARAQLGLLSLGLAEAVNVQHRLGQDLLGRMGGDFFATTAFHAQASAYNKGSAAPAVSLEDAGSLRASAYRLDHDGSQWRLARLGDNTSVSGAGPLVLDGLRVEPGAGTPAAGDSFLLDPLAQASGSFSLLLKDPARLAAAAPLRVTTPTANAGSAALTELAAANAAALPLAAPLTLRFDPDAMGAGIPGFVVSGALSTSLAYDPSAESAGKAFTLPALGIAFSIEGEPDAGDSFAIGNNTGGAGDNRNALMLAGLQQRDLLEGGTSSFQELYGSLTARVGTSTRDAETSLGVESALLQQTQQHRESASGVNLDEEAADMLRYQQLYQAAARLVQVADEMFQTLLEATR